MTGDGLLPGQGTDGVRLTGPRPLGSLGDLAELLDGRSHRSQRFLGGLVVGALVGAAVAGTTMLRKRRDANRS